MSEQLVRFRPKGAPSPVGAYEYGIKVKPGSSWIFVSGLAPLDDKGEALVGFDIYAQTCRVMDRMKKVLETAGATIDDIVYIRMSTTDVHDWERCCDAWGSYLKESITCVYEVVPGFAYGLGQLVQIDAVAASHK